MRGWQKVLAWIVVLGIAVQATFGALWWARALAVVPAYGDTVEYLKLADTLRIDGYRTLAYPLLVRGALEVSTATGVPWQVPLYLVQTLCAVLAIAYVVRSIAPRARRVVVVLVTVLAASSPLIVHYATTVLSDSLAASAFVVAVCGAARVIFRADRSAATLVATATASLAAALLRTEKAAVLVATVVVFLLGAVLMRRTARSWPALRSLAAVSCAAVLLPALAAAGMNHISQTADLGRPAPGLGVMAMSRVVWPHLEAIRDDLPAEVRSAVSVDDARGFDLDNNSAMPMTARLRELDGGGDRFVLAAARAALRCCAAQVLASTAGDAVEYAVTPVAFAVEASPYVSDDQPPNTVTVWDLTRMRAAAPSLTAAYLRVSFVLIAIVVLAATSQLVGPRREYARTLGLGVAVVVGTVINGIAFAMAQGADANVRYGLPNVIALTALLGAAALGPRAPWQPQEPAEAAALTAARS